MNKDVVDVNRQVENLAASYRLLEDDAARGLGAVKDRLNQSILEQWIGLAKSGKLTEEHIEDIRSRCTLSFSIKDKKRAKKATDKLTPSLDALGTPRKKKRKTNRSGRQQNDNDAAASAQNDDDEEMEDGDGDDGDDEAEDQALAAAATAARQAKLEAAANRIYLLKRAKDKLTDHQARWRRHVDNEDGIKYDTPYLLVKLPSIMSLTEYQMDAVFANEDDFAQYGIMKMIQGVIKLHEVGMEASKPFHEVGQKQWTPVVYSTLGGLALDLEEQVNTTAMDSDVYQNAWKAVQHAKDTFEFVHPKGYSLHDLAKFFLTMNVGTRNYLLSMVHCFAGIVAFDSLSMAKLTEGRDGRDPTLSSDDLVLLGYHGDERPGDGDALLKRFKSRFDDKSVSYDNKTKLMLAFIRIKKNGLEKLRNRSWAKIDSIDDDGIESSTAYDRRYRYFDSDDASKNDRRRNNVFMTLTMLVCSTYIREHTSADVVEGGVEYSPSCDGVASLLYRNSSKST